MLMANCEDQKINPNEEGNKTAIILLGLPGSGKTTQARLLSLSYGFTYVSPGDIFRDLSITYSDGQIREQIESYLRQGVLIPDELFRKVMKAPLKKFFDTSRKFILDGLPRNFTQAEWLDVSFREEGIQSCRAVYLNVSISQAKERVADRLNCKNCYAPGGYYKGQTRCDFCGSNLAQRVDDKSTRIDDRLGEYMKQTEPLIHWYRAENKLIEIDGERAIHIVLAEIIKALQFKFTF